MGYKGRIISITIVLFLYIYWNAYTYIIDGSLHMDELRFWFSLAVSIVEGIIGWWIGKQFDRVKFLSERDYLTKAYNRRWVYKKYDRFFNNLDDTDRIKVTLVDINQFKFINDHYGHEIGDKAICEVAESLINRVDKSGIVARWGGDEFLVIEKRSKAELTAVEVESFHLSSGIMITASKGTVTCEKIYCTLDELVREADQMMYTQKQNYKKERMTSPLR